MTCPKCGGAVIEVTDSDDRERMYMCTECGHQGPARDFPDPGPEPEPKPGLIARARMRLAELIAPRV